MLSRRIALRIGVSLPVFAWLWPSLEACLSERFGLQVWRLFRNPSVADAVGRRLKHQSFPNSRLASAVETVRRSRARLPAIPPDAAAPLLKTALQQRIAADFRAGRTLWFEGWLLAETEAHLLLIAHLSASPSARRNPPRRTAA